jgi:hypothetical protein
MQPIKSESPREEVLWGFLLISKRTIKGHRKPRERNSSIFFSEVNLIQSR